MVALGYTGRRYVRKKGRKKESLKALKYILYLRCGPAFDAQVRPRRYLAVSVVTPLLRCTVRMTGVEMHEADAKKVVGLLARKAVGN